MARYQKRYTRAQIIRNRLMVLLAAVVLILAVILAVRGISSLLAPKQELQAPALPTRPSMSRPAEISTAVSDASATETPPQTPAAQPVRVDPLQQLRRQLNEQYASSPYFEAEMPLLVNYQNVIPDDYTPHIVSMGNGYNVDEKANTAYQAMLKAASADGINLWVISAYRSYEKQVSNFNAKVQEYRSYGYSEEAAYAATAEYIAIPGTSEHTLGLAIDICSLEESFEETRAFQWLIRHCSDYGFVLRYPKDKVDLTKIAYEPWHYRYVGINHAKFMESQGLCLEEYVEQYR